MYQHCQHQKDKKIAEKTRLKERKEEREDARKDKIDVMLELIKQHASKTDATHQHIHYLCQWCDSISGNVQFSNKMLA